jgi:hypothetical protein
VPRPFALAPEDVTAARVTGCILCHDVIAVSELGRVRLGKGRILTNDDVAALRNFGGELHLLEMEPSDVHEDEASARLARAIAGEGLEQREPVESQSYLRATYRGLLEVRPDVLRQINALPDVSVFTAYDAQPVKQGTMVAATKVTPLAVPGSVIERAEEIARQAGPVVRVRPFTGGRVGVVVRERLTDRNRAKFEAAIQMKVGWFGSPLAGICYLPDDVTAIAEAIAAFQANGAALILAAGVNSTDPLDLTIQALEQVGARTEKRGVPAHPGSTCWLAYLDETPIFGLALCGMFSKTTVLDLLLPHFLSGRRVRAEDLAAFGHGGVLSKDMAFRFPAYAPDGD